MSDDVRRRPPSLVVAALVAVALAAGACSGSKNDGNAAAEADGTSTTAPATKTSGGIPIGPANEGVAGVEAFRVPSRNHTEQPLDYDHRPPVGGNHFPVPSTCGFYTAATRPPDELLVHDLEHGSIWFAYQPDLPTAQLDKLRQLIGREYKTVATPYDGLESPLVLSAWARQLPVNSIDDPRVQQFIDTYRATPADAGIAAGTKNHSQAPEPSAACQGVGQPEPASPTS